MKIGGDSASTAVRIAKTVAGAQAVANVPTVAQLERDTLELVQNGTFDVAVMRQRITARYGVHRDSPDWPALVNNHAWALVRLQRSYQIRKVNRGHYRLETRPITTIGDAITSVYNGGVLAAWAETLRNRAKQVNRDGCAADTLSLEDMVELWRRCGRRCALTGIAFSETIVGTGRAKRAFAPSLDRIDPEWPYNLDNCRLVLTVVNFALNRFGIEVFDQIVVGRARTRKWLRRKASARGKWRRTRSEPESPLSS